MNMRSRAAGWLLLVFVFLAGCTKQESKPVTIALNPWPGYEFLYLAEQLGYFDEVGTSIKLVQLASLGDAQRAYVNGRVDGMASTLIEAVQAEYLGGKPLKVVLVADYSNGGDVIIASTDIKSISELKGRTVGCEVSSLGVFVLQRALTKAGMTLDDVTVKNTEQADGRASLNDGKIEAFVTYPPYSVNTLKDTRFHKLFSSAEIPFEIVDTVSISEAVLQQQPKLVPKLHTAWQMALDFTRNNPEQAYRMMAEREGISVEDFKAVLKDLVILGKNEQQALFLDSAKLDASAHSVCATLVHTQSLMVDCDQQRSLIYRGSIM
jgi:NitT/TauT family transport system substrate-binding protein